VTKNFNELREAMEPERRERNEAAAAEQLAFWTEPQPEEHASLLYDNSEAFVFQLQDDEVLRIQRDGDVLVHGRTCGNDTEVFEAVQRFFKTAFKPTFGAAERGG
jgi:hypothetical protein